MLAGPPAAGFGHRGRQAATASSHTRYWGLSTRLVTRTTRSSASIRSAGFPAGFVAGFVAARDRRGVHHHAVAASMATISTTEQAVATVRAAGEPNWNDPQS